MEWMENVLLVREKFGLEERRETRHQATRGVGALHMIPQFVFFQHDETNESKSFR